MFKVILSVCVLFAAYFLAWPVPVAPKVWQAPALASYSGDFVANQRLAEFDALTMDNTHGAEAATIDGEGMLYASSHEGWVLRGDPKGDGLQRWVNVDGRPLGLAFDAAGNLWVANAYVGLMRVTPAGEVSTELTEVDKTPIVFADDVVVAPNGKIYLSDATTKFAAKDWGGTLPASLLDLMEHGLYGRIIEFDPATRQSRVIMADLSFANGVTMDPAGQFLLVAETGAYRIWKYWLAGEKLGQSEVIIDQLPGFPDNIHLGQNGRYWVGLTAPRSDALDKLSGKPFLRKVVQRLPAFMQPKVVPYGLVFAIDKNGKVLENLQAPNGEVYATTGVAETDDYIFVTSLTMPVLARYSKEQLRIITRGRGMD